MATLTSFGWFGASSGSWSKKAPNVVAVPAGGAWLPQGISVNTGPASLSISAANASGIGFQLAGSFTSAAAGKPPKAGGLRPASLPTRSLSGSKRPTNARKLGKNPPPVNGVVLHGESAASGTVDTIQLAIGSGLLLLGAAGIGLRVSPTGALNASAGPVNISGLAKGPLEPIEPASPGGIGRISSNVSIGTGVVLFDFYGLLCQGVIATGDGADVLTGAVTAHASYRSLGLYNSGQIMTGRGNDLVTGSGTIGIYNKGTIVLGDGDDTVDALQGGFAGGGYLEFGLGRNTLKGFGDQTVFGGTGNLSDHRILLNPGTYVITAQSGSAFTISHVEDPAVMSVAGFGVIGADDRLANASLLPLHAGTLEISANGAAAYLSL